MSMNTTLVRNATERVRVGSGEVRVLVSGSGIVPRADGAACCCCCSSSSCAKRPN